MTQTSGGPLSGIRVMELAGIGPGPFCGMMLGDMGADVVRLTRPAPPGSNDPATDILLRNRRTIVVDLKHPAGVDLVLRLCESADAIFEGFRPGVAERLGVGPQTCMERNPRLVYGRVTGWGQDGPLAHAAGHDINYISLTGVLHAIGQAGGKPVPPLNLVGDFGGGGMLLAFGIVCALFEARASGKGQVVDAAMIDGSAALMAMIYTLRHAGIFSAQRGTNLLDGGAPHYDCYETRDGGYVSVGAVEPEFYALLCERLELPPELFGDRSDHTRRAHQRDYLAALFRQRTRAEWCSLLEGTDTCFAPVLEAAECAAHPHHRARQTFIPIGGMQQPAPAPRFSRTVPAPPRPAEAPGLGTAATLHDWALSPDEVRAVVASGAVRTV